MEDYAIVIEGTKIDLTIKSMIMLTTLSSIVVKSKL